MNTGAKPAVGNQVEAARALYALGRYQGALGALTSPGENVAEFYTMRGLCLHALQRWEEAAEAFQKVLEVDLHRIHARVALGACLLHMDRPEEALAHFDRCTSSEARDRALDDVFDSLCAIGRALRQRSPSARVLFVDYLTMLPAAGAPAPPLSAADADLGRHVAATLERLTADAAAATGCEVIGAAAASRDHHAWSAEPWTTRPGVPLPGRPAPLHPNGAGMRAVAELVSTQL